jgi:hypothetical protein
MSMLSYIKNAIGKWWANFTMSAEDRYLSQATDIVDLEGRLKNIMFHDHHNYNRFRGA